MARAGTTSSYLVSSTSLGSPITSIPFTTSTWFYKPVSGSDTCIISFGDSSSVNLYGFRYTGSASTIYAYLGTGATDVDTTGMVTGWNHICWTVSSTTSRIFNINGITGTTHTTSKSITDSLNRWSVLAFCDSSPSNYGVSDQPVFDAAVWNIALSHEDCQSIYNYKLCPLSVRPKNLVAYAPLNDGDGGARDFINRRNFNESGIVGLSDNASIKYLRRSFSGFTPGVPPPPPVPPNLRSVFRGFSF